MTLILDVQGKNIEIAVTQEWEGWLTWNERDVSWMMLDAQWDWHWVMVHGN